MCIRDSLKLVRGYIRQMGKSEPAEVYRIHVVRLEIPVEIHLSGEHLLKFRHQPGVGYQLLEKPDVKRDILTNQYRLSLIHI